MRNYTKEFIEHLLEVADTTLEEELLDCFGLHVIDAAKDLPFDVDMETIKEIGNAPIFTKGMAPHESMYLDLLGVEDPYEIIRSMQLQKFNGETIVSFYPSRKRGVRQMHVELDVWGLWVANIPGKVSREVVEYFRSVSGHLPGAKKELDKLYP
jgi:hypothetical protein